MKAEREEDKPVQSHHSQHQPAPTTLDVTHQFPFPEMTNINLFGISVYLYKCLHGLGLYKICKNLHFHKHYIILSYQKLSNILLLL